MPKTATPTAVKPCSPQEGVGRFDAKLLEPKGGHAWTSRTVWALILFALACQLMSWTNIGKLQSEDFAYPTWTSWTIHDFIAKREKHPDLVFLGSSLMLVPLDGADSDFTGLRIDGARHHKSVMFEEKFKQYSGSPVSTFNFALPGEMPSDAYLITKFLLKDERRPNIIVYGVGPRDFMENLLPSPNATDSFRYLSRLGDYGERINLIAPEWEQRLSYYLAQFIYPLAKSEDIKVSLERGAVTTFAKLFPSVKPSGVNKRRALLPNYHPYEIHHGEFFFRPTTDANRPAFVDNIEEYRKRYKKLKWDTFNSQMQFLEDSIDIANSRGTHVVLVAMPITQSNRDIIPEKAWIEYQGRLQAMAAKKDATYIDMFDTKEFPRSDFCDTVHLHSGGGAKFLDALARRLSANHAVISGLNVNRQDDEGSSIAGLEGQGL